MIAWHEFWPLIGRITITWYKYWPLIGCWLWTHFRSGLDFDQHSSHGIDTADFGEMFIRYETFFPIHKEDSSDNIASTNCFQKCGCNEWAFFSPTTKTWETFMQTQIVSIGLKPDVSFNLVLNKSNLLLLCLGSLHTYLYSWMSLISSLCLL